MSETILNDNNAKTVENMSEEELRVELIKVRGMRAGKGRQKRRESKTKRIRQGVTDKTRRKNVEAEADADWV